MEPREILRQEVDDIKSKIHENIFVDTSEFLGECVGLGSVPKSNKSNPIGPLKKPIPWLFSTRTYRDEGCATYQLIRFLMEYFETPPKKILWRRQPQVIEHHNFFRCYKEYKGFVRFAVEEKETCKNE